MVIWKPVAGAVALVLAVLAGPAAVAAEEATTGVSAVKDRSDAAAGTAQNEATVEPKAAKGAEPGSGEADETAPVAQKPDDDATDQAAGAKPATEIEPASDPAARNEDGTGIAASTVETSPSDTDAPADESGVTDQATGGAAEENGSDVAGDTTEHDASAATDGEGREAVANDAAPRPGAQDDDSSVADTAPASEETKTGTASQTETASGDRDASQTATQAKAGAEDTAETEAGTGATADSDAGAGDVASDDTEKATTAKTASGAEETGEPKGDVDAAGKDPTAEPELFSSANSTPAEPPNALTIATWGGAYQQAQERAFIHKFAEIEGTSIRLIEHDRDATGAIEPVSANAEWDVADLPADEVASACERELLEPADPAALEAAPAGNPASEDFLEGALTECGVASMAWSSVVVFDRRHLGDAAPASLGEVFDPESVPGKRAFPQRPEYLLEMALMADGVAPDNVYKALGKDGVERALAVLDRVREEIVWWSKPDEPYRLLNNGEAVLAVAYSGRAFNEVVGQTNRLGILWDGQIYRLNAWAVSRSAINKKAARAFVARATAAESLAEQARLFPYGPMRRSALERVGRHPVLNVEMRGFLPTEPGNFRRALRFDAGWWAENGRTVRRRFQAWLSQPADEAGQSGPEDGEQRRNASEQAEPSSG